MQSCPYVCNPPLSKLFHPLSFDSNNFEQYSDCTKLCEDRVQQLFPPETTTAPQNIDLSIYDDTNVEEDYYNDDDDYTDDDYVSDDENRYSKYSHLAAYTQESWQDRKRSKNTCYLPPLLFAKMNIE